jgi:uncharacterized protein HemY
MLPILVDTKKAKVFILGSSQVKQAYSEWRPSVRARKHGKNAVIGMDSGQIPQKSRKRVRENAHSPERCPAER